LHILKRLGDVGELAQPELLRLFFHNFLINFQSK